MGKLNLKKYLRIFKHKLPAVLVLSLLCVVVLNWFNNGIKVIQASLEPEAEKYLRETRYKELANKEPVDVKKLLKPLEELNDECNETLICNTQSAVADFEKSKAKINKKNRAMGGVVQPEPLPKASNKTACKQTLEKTKKAQTANGGKTDGLSEGQEGAQSLADLKGSINQFSLTRAAEAKGCELIRNEWASTGPAFNRFCAKNPDFCPQQAHQNGRGWLVPIAVAQAQSNTTNHRAFQASLASDQTKAEQQNKQAGRTEALVAAQMASYQHYSQLADSLDLIMAKQNEFNQNFGAIKTAVLQLEIKMDQGGNADHCNVMAVHKNLTKKRWWETSEFSNCVKT